MVGLTHVTLAPLAIPALAKFCIVTATALAFSLLTYHAWVRYTWLGAWLNGKRVARAPAALPQIYEAVAEPAESAPAESRRKAA
jgi:hypothetical protein